MALRRLFLILLFNLFFARISCGTLERIWVCNESDPVYCAWRRISPDQTVPRAKHNRIASRFYPCVGQSM